LAGIEFRNKSPFFFKVEQKFIASQSRVPQGTVPSEAAFITGLLFGITYHGKLTHRATLSFDNIFDNKYHNYLAHERGLSILEPGISTQLSYTLEF
jgi:hypothetical protein